MKKIYKIIILCAMGVALVSCGGCSGKEDYKSAIERNDYEAAHKIIKQLNADFEKEKSEQLAKGDDFMTEERMSVESKAQTYFEAIKDVYGSEVMYLLSDNNSEIDTKITFILNEMPNLGIKYQKGKELHFEGYHEYQKECLNYFLYSESVRCNNLVCNKILSIAIAMKNDKIARLALSQFKDECMTARKDFSDIVQYYSDAKDEAQRKYDEALANGVFE